MATIIDSLMVTLGLDPSQFKKGMEESGKAQEGFAEKGRKISKERQALDKKAVEAQRKQAKEFELQGKKAAQTFSKIRNEALAIVGIFAGGRGMVDFARDTITSVAGLERLSEVTGEGINNLGGWGLALQNVGGSAEEMNQQILKSSQDVASFQNGMANGNVRSFLALGGKVSELKDAHTYLLGISRVIRGMIDKYGNESRAWNFAQMLGISYDTFNLLKQGPALVQAQVAADEKLVGVTNQMGNEAKTSQKAINNLDSALKKMGMTTLFLATPALQKMGDALNRAMAGWDNLISRSKNPIFSGLATLFGAETPEEKAHREMVEHDKIWKVPMSSDSKARGLRNNNPGNIKYGKFAQKMGATGADAQGFAIFPSMDQGVLADQMLILHYMKNGYDTVRKIVGKYAPSSENDTNAYISAVSKRMHVSPDAKLNPNYLGSLTSAIIAQENGLRMARAQNITATTHIGQVSINTAATDANGIAGSIAPALASNGQAMAWQANSGVIQ